MRRICNPPPDKLLGIIEGNVPFPSGPASRRVKHVFATQPGASGLLKAFRSPLFDTSMARSPGEMTATDLFEGEIMIEGGNN